jgi:hypothetical protein
MQERFHQGKVIPFGHGTQATSEVETPKTKRKFPIILATDAMKWPPPEYWDKERLFLKAYDGSVNMIYADFSNLKTTFAVCHALTMAREHDVKILYLASEGVGFLGPLILLGAVTAWNNTHSADEQIKPDWINAHFRLVAVPPDVLTNDLSVLKKELEEEGWDPDLVFLDTLGACAAGQNLSAPEVGTAIGKNLRQFCQPRVAAYVSDVFVVHHIGKEKDKGALGSRYYMHDADQALELTYDQDKGLLQVKVTKARGGEKDRKVMFGVRKVRLPNGAETMVVYPFDKDDPRATPPVEEKQRDKDAERVWVALRSFPVGAIVGQNELLDRLLGKREPCESEEQHEATRKNWRKNKLMRLAWLPGNKAKGIPERKGPIYPWIVGVALERPAKPKQPFTFVVPQNPERLTRK